MIDLDYLAFLEDILTDNRKEKFLKVLENRTKHFTIAVEDVYQMHNTSAVMRSCEVFGIQELNIIEQRFGKRIDKEIALGAQKWVDINRFDTVDGCISSLRDKGYQIIATTPHENDCLIQDFDISKPSALFFGTEKDGLSPEILEKADGFLKIPMVGFTESLNISVSAAIIIQNLTNRLRNSDIKWKLSDEEILQKRLDWAKNSIRDIKRIEARYYQDNPR
ncbi:MULTISPECIES: TrmH family RNA methyltransferase [Flavobacterium]|jgi:tRNA (guanosine-2'-O-)-methyltransferase|uniref:tRNA (guanosine(18)-2'-O)-methyltransferase n=2 Tax=Flavobacterium johnsoniae TaxID=986 RepID=A0A1M6WMH3_FLAJO|nr:MULTISPECIES: RNA methyltransferase [Flavobacterium]ABQ08008.1 tRNA/rRNA methyltransferase (SpoU) [Flavobacterium johnsoniae UW101]OXG02085.1 rRNA methyltransferase [Flavobacterium johnsoniae UW101]WDF58752.1 RNA methyltransferase [Flavobacterium sp. KACC 22758]WQG80146.1 RNA methyltransferase [Flavobacterium johnsoniae UW101]SHG41331.1 tRNA (guanosine-2'-O-)-methyltransferase [Flavobacterium johnsoniae]